MQVTVEKTFPIEAPASSAWALLEDIRAVAECMPGAEVTEQIDEHHYKGQVRVKVGPAAATFKGDIEVRSVDPDSRQIALTGKGTDVKGTSGASMDLSARVVDAGDGRCELTGTAEVSVSGKMATFGGRMMNQVSDQILRQFGANFGERVAASGDSAAGEPSSEPAADRPQRELNALALLWSIIAGFFRSLLGRGKSTG